MAGRLTIRVEISVESIPVVPVDVVFSYERLWVHPVVRDG